MRVFEHWQNARSRIWFIPNWNEGKRLDRLLAIETFVRVIETDAFSAAARIQNIGQPAVSKAISQLEEWLGVRLLLGSTTGLTPTEAGLSFYERARRTIEEADEAVIAARGTAAALSGQVRVSAAVCFARLHVVPKLSAFLAANPDVEVELLPRRKATDQRDRRVARSSIGGLGLTVASEFAFSPELKRRTVVTALDDWTLPAISLSAVYPTGRMASSKARAFVSFVEECLKE
jgi:DNA-binding transcriptional LysR family regulator